MSNEELLAQILRLPRSERARVAEQVLSCIEEPEGDVAAAWADDLQRRSRELADGTVEPVPMETARTEILADLKQRRGD